MTVWGRRVAVGVAATIAAGCYSYSVDWRDLSQHTASATEGAQPVVTPMLPRAYLDAMNAADQRGHEVWDAVADCESGSRDRKGHINAGTANWASTAGHFDGGLQFDPGTWRDAGGLAYAPHAYEATRTEQIAVADSWLARTSWSQWPWCSRKLGLR